MLVLVLKTKVNCLCLARYFLFRLLLKSHVSQPTTCPAACYCPALPCIILCTNSLFINRILSFRIGCGRNLQVGFSLVGNCSADTFNYTDPTITSISYSTAPTPGGGTLSLVGSNFGPMYAIHSVFIHGTQCPTVIWLSQFALNCITPEGYGVNLSVTLSVANPLNPSATVSVLAPSTYTYDPPSISSLSFDPSPTAGGSPLTVNGHNFGPKRANQIIEINGTLCTSVDYISHSLLVCMMVAGWGQDSICLSQFVSGL